MGLLHRIRSLGNQSQVSEGIGEGEIMKNEEIVEKRAELQAKSKTIWDEWQAYDKQYPVLPGAYRPPNYDSQQRAFQARLRAVSDELRMLPRTPVKNCDRGIHLDPDYGCNSGGRLRHVLNSQRQGSFFL
jgi:hypothetical protein